MPFSYNAISPVATFFQISFSEICFICTTALFVLTRANCFGTWSWAGTQSKHFAFLVVRIGRKGVCNNINLFHNQRLQDLESYYTRHAGIFD